MSDTLHVIALDVDGVLNTARSATAFSSSVFTLDPVAVGLVSRLLDTHNATLVIVSDWRFDFMGLLRAELMACTHGEHVWSCLDAVPLDNTIEERSVALKQWLDDALKEYQHIKLVILDDATYPPEWDKHLVHVNSSVGITYENYIDARRIFDQPAVYEPT